jgi:hypothetical protein
MLHSNSSVESKFDQPALENIRIRDGEVGAPLGCALDIVLHVVDPAGKFIVLN